MNESIIAVYRHITLILTFFLACSACLNVVQYIMGKDQQAHIERLAEYIEDNEWPTPAWPLPDIDIDIRRK